MALHIYLIYVLCTLLVVSTSICFGISVYDFCQIHKFSTFGIGLYCFRFLPNTFAAHSQTGAVTNNIDSMFSWVHCTVNGIVMYIYIVAVYIENQNRKVGSIIVYTFWVLNTESAF